MVSQEPCLLSLLRRYKLTEISVEVDPGLNVFLTGKVWNEDEFKRAIELASGVKGVKVVNHKIVNLRKTLDEQFRKGQFRD